MHELHDVAGIIGGTYFAIDDFGERLAVIPELADKAAIEHNIEQ